MNKFIKRIKNNQALYILSILIIGILLLLIARITYAYLAPRIQSALGNVTTISDTVDDFKLELGRPLSLNATSTTLPESGSNLVVTSTEIAKLKANSTKKTANYNYYLYLQITNNTFKYSDGTTPEIILTITDPSGNEITSLNNLKYGTYNGVSGFDVTTAKGLFAIANNYEITSNSSSSYTEHDWNITLTYLNLNIDQSSNYGNSFETKLYLQKEEMKPTLSEYVISKYTGTQGKNDLYYHDGNLANGINDNSYRYAGANPDNYVCFSSNNSTCPEDNLYRIIGVFENKTNNDKTELRAKLIKSSSIGNKQWDSSRNTWSSSNLNTYLNGTFINTFDETLKEKIDNTTWKVGGNGNSKIRNEIPKIAYQNEILNPVTTNSMDSKTEYSAKIGLMYVSDYGFSASSNYWMLPFYSSNNNDYRKAADFNWLYTGNWEWTITRNSDVTASAYFIYQEGAVYGHDTRGVRGGARPVFYLKSSIKYISGTGTSSDPIMIS